MKSHNTAQRLIPSYLRYTLRRAAALFELGV